MIPLWVRFSSKRAPTVRISTIDQTSDALPVWREFLIGDMDVSGITAADSGQIRGGLAVLAFLRVPSASRLPTRCFVVFRRTRKKHAIWQGHGCSSTNTSHFSHAAASRVHRRNPPYDRLLSRAPKPRCQPNVAHRRPGCGVEPGCIAYCSDGRVESDRLHHGFHRAGYRYAVQEIDGIDRQAARGPPESHSGDLEAGRRPGPADAVRSAASDRTCSAHGRRSGGD